MKKRHIRDRARVEEPAEAVQGATGESVERSFAWAVRFRRLAKDYERLPATVAGLRFVAFT